MREKKNDSAYHFRSRLFEKKLGDIFVKAKHESGICLKELSIMTGMSITKLNNIINLNTTTGIRIDDVVELCRAFRISIIIDSSGVELINKGE